MNSPAATLLECTPGPWGKISYYHFYLEAPDYVVAQFPLPGTTTRWAFLPQQTDEIPTLLKDAGMPAGVVDQMTEPRRIAKDARQTFVFPPHEVLEALSPEARARIYKVLAANPANAFHYYPVFFLADSVEEWARDSDIPPSLLNAIKALSYRSGEALVFSDVPLLLSKA